MSFIRWYSGPVLVGFLFSMLVNPVMAALGFMIWGALIYYIARRWAGTPEH
ncbi:MAG TPA: hypothetical protein PKA10_06105 [Selenomonadales bacterium]|nr:hypothetical protein [Selenomonadales bacterium]